MKDALEEASSTHDKRGWADAATGGGIAAMIFGPTKLVRNLGAAAAIGGLGGRALLQHMETEQLEKVMTRYNADLSRRVYTHKIASVPNT